MSRVSLVAALALFALLFAGCGRSPQASAGAPQPMAAMLLPAGGQNGFLVGGNYPWLTYGADFGAGPRRRISVHYGGVFDDDFASMKQDGVQVVRWFVFADGRSGIDFAADGTPLALQPEVLEDLDAAVAIARQHDMYLMPVLFDYLYLSAARTQRGLRTGGHTDSFTDPRKRLALIDNVVAPVLEHFHDEPRILAWDLMNEPEWAIADLPEPSVEKDIAAMHHADFLEFASRVAAIAHRAGSRVTVGSASLKWINAWTPSYVLTRGLPAPDLDFYQVHYYPWMDGKCGGALSTGEVCWSPLEQDVAGLGLDRPVLVGEMEAATDLGARLDRLIANGYAGALLWSFHATVGSNWDGLRAWTTAHAASRDLARP